MSHRAYVLEEGRIVAEGEPAGARGAAGNPPRVSRTVIAGSMQWNGKSVDVGVLVGSLRRQSFSRKLALRAARHRAAEPRDCTIIEIGAMPLYNQDDETATRRKPGSAFARQIERGGRAAVHHAGIQPLDPVGAEERDRRRLAAEGRSVFDAKPAAVISLSPGVLGAFGANHHLRQCLMCLNVAVMPAPEAYIGGVDKLFDDDGAIAVEATRQFLDQFMRAFADWIDAYRARRPDRRRTSLHFVNPGVPQ